ncbi:hypothetical protein [Pseudoxanthomonas mexicana]|uniref:hypothetical protein n=1 Tax=Pseudoxanthomonas mexicana TaxID=128785 RepID=UPI00398BB237
MKPFLPALLCLLSLPLSAAPPAAENKADPGIARQLEQLRYEYEIDEDGDYRLLMAVDEDSGRSQWVYVRSTVEKYGEHRVRELWSYAYRANGSAFPSLVANRLLEASNNLIMGSWVKQDQSAVLVVKIPADADAEALDDAIVAAAQSADEMERELADDPASDDY